MIWREKRTLLIILGLLLAANTIFFFTYRVQYQRRLADFQTRYEETENKLQQAQIARANAERQYAAYRKIERDIQQVYEQQWSTPSRRLTALIKEVKRLAVASNLVPPSYGYSQGEARPQGGAYDPRVARVIGAKTVSIDFTVEGTYQQARRLINLLELSPQFIIIDRIALTSRDNQTLTLTLQVKTLFREDRASGGSPRATALPASASLAPTPVVRSDS